MREGQRLGKKGRVSVGREHGRDRKIKRKKNCKKDRKKEKNDEEKEGKTDAILEISFFKLSLF